MKRRMGTRPFSSVTSAHSDLISNYSELIVTYDATLEVLSTALDLREREAKGHSKRVTEMTLNLAKAMGVDSQELVNIRRGASLHDVGNLGVPESILRKPSEPTTEEWTIIHMHPQYGYEIMVPIALLRPALDIPYCHHEKWDGSGYPRGLKGKEIPLAARIFSVVDVSDALSYDRPNRAAWSTEKVREYIRDESGTRFDPAVVEVFLQLDN